MQWLKRLKQHINEYGMAVTLGFALHRMLSRVHPTCGLYWYLFYRQPIQSEQLLREGGNLTFRWVHSFRPVLGQLPRPIENIEARFNQNVACIIAMKQDELVACAWFAFGRYVEDEVQCTYRVPTHAVWDFDVYVSPRFRMGRTFARTWQAANEGLSERGYKYSLSRISAYNLPSRSAHMRLGAEHIGSAVFLKLGRLQVMCSSLKPHLHAKLIREEPPELKFKL
ncbi:hypothetical protein [Chromatocurvus halotolerans]|uniref:Acetyltransferase (GNAT) family protein n=1 Tax=Chromatocurvus halotolerans TaxID=1132028 RepID=A0A4R2KKV3_9GAMM|nr:hypothetical protein [Chromatocurvus halotolerans]TCO74303.1 hypothetical protein EV688_11416 [Chromatocurvus halotolerans]